MNILLFVILCLAHFSVDFMLGVFAVHKTMVGLDLAVAGALCFMGALIGEGSQAVFGALGDRGYRKSLLVFGLLFSALNGLLGYSQGHLSLFALLLCAYLGSAAFHPAGAAIVGSFTSEKKGLYLSIFASCGSFGLAASQVVYYRVYQMTSGGTAVLSLPGLIAALVLLLLLRKQHSPVTSGSSDSMLSVLKLFRFTPLRRLYAALVCHQTLYWSVIFLLPDILHARGCSEWIAFGGGHMAFMLGGAMMMVPCGLMADRFSPRQVILCAMMTSVLLLYVFLSMPFTQPIFVLPCLMALGSALGVVSPVGVAFGQRLLPGRPGLVSAYVMGMVWCVAESLGPAAGVLTKCFDSAHAPAVALMVLGCLNLLGATAAYFLPRCPKSAQVHL